MMVMENATKIILEANPNNLDTSVGAYDVYRLLTDEFTSFDDLAFVETVDQLPEGAVRINEDEPTGPDYDAAYVVEPTPVTEIEVIDRDNQRADQLKRDRVLFVWWDDQDPTNPGWVLRTYDADGDSLDEPLDADDRDNPEAAADEALRIVR